MKQRHAIITALLATAACGDEHGANVGDGSGATRSASRVDPPPVAVTTNVGVEATSTPSVLQFHKHVNRDGLFVDAKMTSAYAAAFHKDHKFVGSLTGHVYASPLYVKDGVGGKGTVYVAAESDTVFAFDEGTGAQLWKSNVGTPATNSGAGCGNISPIGITGTPAIDPTTRLMVFDAASADGNGNIATHTIYGMSIDDGTAKWSVDVSTLRSGSTPFTPQSQNQRGAVLIVNGTAYVTYGGHWGDCSSYHGWVVGVPLSGSGAQAWATTIDKAGAWGVGGAASDGTSIYVTTGNGSGSSQNWAESEGLFRLGAGPTFSGSTTDYFAPYNWASLDGADLDISGSGPMVIDAPALTPSQLVLAQGKDGWLYLVSRANLGGIATSSQRANVGALQVQSGEISNGGAWATIGGTTYVVIRPNGNNQGVGCPNGTSGDLVAVQLDPTAGERMKVAWCASSNGVGSPVITSSDGTNDPLVWVFGAAGSGRLYAWNLVTGAQVFAGGGSTDVVSNSRRFSSPIAVNGFIFVAADGGLHRYSGN